jgi:hypothetical protein
MTDPELSNDDPPSELQERVRALWFASDVPSAARHATLERIAAAPRYASVSHRLMRRAPLALLAASLLAVVATRIWQQVARPSRDVTPVELELLLPGPTAQSVTVLGDFNGWDRRGVPLRHLPGTHRWSVTLELSGGRHEYGYLVDGTRWVLDPFAPQAGHDAVDATNVVLVANPSP